MESALYDSHNGYYSGRAQGPETGLDYVTSVTISPLFARSVSVLVSEFLNRFEDEVCSIVDIGCGDGALINALALSFSRESGAVRFFGVDRALRNRPSGNVEFLTALIDVPPGRPTLLLSNELFDAFPIHRVVRTAGGLEEIGLDQEQDLLRWQTRPLPHALSTYLDQRSISLEVGQIVDFTPQWFEYYGQMAGAFERALIVTIDYGFEGRQLFDVRVRPTGTAAAFRAHAISRDLLSNPGLQDLTAHVNFSDLQSAGESCGYSTLLFTRQARFLISLGALEDPLLAAVPVSPDSSVQEMLDLRVQRDAARSLILPDGIGDEMRVLVQGKNVPLEGWSFQSQPIDNMPDRKASREDI